MSEFWQRFLSAFVIVNIVVFLVPWLVYVNARLVFWAYFRTKEHFQRREKNGEESA